MQLKQFCYISILFPCLCVMVNAMCTLKKCLCLDLFVIVVKLCKCMTSTDINTKIKLMLVQNYGWPTGPAKIWLWLARRPFGWPRASGKHDPCAPLSVIKIVKHCGVGGEGGGGRQNPTKDKGAPLSLSLR